MPPDPALLDRTLASIRSNFESLRRFDPIPALMAESPTGQREELGSGKSPVPSVPAWNHSACRWLGSSSILEDGKPVAGRDLWVAASGPSVDRLKLAAEAAAGFTTVLRESVGIPKPSRAGNPWNLWFWTVFEVAEAKPPYSVLRLKGGGVFRTAVGGTFSALVSDLEEVERNGPPSDEPVGGWILSQDYSPIRYWELNDFVEASLWALDLVAVALPAVIDRERGVPETSQGALLETALARQPRGPLIDELLAALHKEDPDFAETAPLRELRKRLLKPDGKPVSLGGIDASHFYQSKLKPLRKKVEAVKKQVRHARKYADFNSIAAPDVDVDKDH